MPRERPASLLRRKDKEEEDDREEDREEDDREQRSLKRIHTSKSSANNRTKGKTTSCESKRNTEQEQIFRRSAIKAKKESKAFSSLSNIFSCFFPSFSCLVFSLAEIGDLEWQDQRGNGLSLYSLGTVLCSEGAVAFHLLHNISWLLHDSLHCLCYHSIDWINCCHHHLEEGKEQKAETRTRRSPWQSQEKKHGTDRRRNKCQVSKWVLETNNGSRPILC